MCPPKDTKCAMCTQWSLCLKTSLTHHSPGEPETTPREEARHRPHARDGVYADCPERAEKVSGGQVGGSCDVSPAYSCSGATAGDTAGLALILTSLPRVAHARHRTYKLGVSMPDEDMQMAQLWPCHRPPFHGRVNDQDLALYTAGSCEPQAPTPGMGTLTFQPESPPRWMTALSESGPC